MPKSSTRLAKSRRCASRFPSSRLCDDTLRMTVAGTIRGANRACRRGARTARRAELTSNMRHNVSPARPRNTTLKERVDFEFHGLHYSSALLSSALTRGIRKGVPAQSRTASSPFSSVTVSYAPLAPEDLLISCAEAPAPCKTIAPVARRDRAPARARLSRLRASEKRALRVSRSFSRNIGLRFVTELAQNSSPPGRRDRQGWRSASARCPERSPRASPRGILARMSGGPSRSSSTLSTTLAHELPERSGARHRAPRPLRFFAITTNKAAALPLLAPSSDCSRFLGLREYQRRRH